MTGLEIGVTAAVSALVLLVEHWWPAEKMLGKRMHQCANYVQGVLALVIPLSVLFWMWGDYQAILAVWAVVVSGGLATIGAYAVDGWIVMRCRAQIAEDEAQLLRPDDGKAA
jgi:hypothetical protein